jgi:toxin ParE1/3/4
VTRAVSWYDQQRAGLGQQFLHQLNEATEMIASAPLSAPAIRGRIRRAVIRRFPYLLFYVIEEEEVIVLACLHASRDPERWP